MLLVIAAELYRLSNSTPAQTIPPEIKANREKRYSLERFGFGSGLGCEPSFCSGIEVAALPSGDLVLAEDAYRYAPWRTELDVGNARSARVVGNRVMGDIGRQTLLILVVVGYAIYDTGAFERGMKGADL
jgi:hypothetical protein